MDATFPNVPNLITLVIPAIFILLILELILSATWNHAYFTVGLPLYWRRVPVTSGRYGLPSETELEDSFGPTFWSRPLKFHAFDSNEYGFREELFSFRWFQQRSTSVMHGLLTYDPSEHQVVVKGYANGWLLLVTLVFLAVVIGTGEFVALLFLGIVFLITGVMYLVERSRFDRVVDLVASQTYSAKA